MVSKVLARGIGASGGAVVGKAVFTLEAAHQYSMQDVPFILVGPDTCADYCTSFDVRYFSIYF